MSNNNPLNVSVRIEPSDEYQIQEISYDGQEKYIHPLSMAENLTRLIQKIDFNQPIDELKAEVDNLDDDKDQRPTTSHAALWPFESMRNKVRTALTEICVLHDLLLISKEKKYMVFDTVSAECEETRPIVQLLTKKKALQSAAEILKNGAETLKQPVHQLDNQPLSFYDELLLMRQSWRLKRIGSNIIGDLSYRTTGSRFYQYSSSNQGRFEVIKNDPTQLQVGNIKQALRVKVPSELEGHAYIQVSIVKDGTILAEASSSSTTRCQDNLSNLTWQETLDNAQDVIFCKELFSQLAKEAVQYQFVIPTTVTGNQIVIALFPNVKLVINLIHFTPYSKSSAKLSDSMLKLKKDHRYVLEHSLHRILREFHASTSKKSQRIDGTKESGASASDKQTILDATKQESLIKQIVVQAQHQVLREQTIHVIDTFAKNIKDPIIVSHWFCLNSPNCSIVRVNIYSDNYESLGRTSMIIHIKARDLYATTRDGKTITLGYEPEELTHLLHWQTCLHQINTALSFSKLLGWVNLASNPNVGVCRDDGVTTAASLVISSANGEHMISLKLGPQFGLVVSVASQRDIDHSLQLKDATSSKLENLVSEFREVDWDKMEGKSFLGKLELLIAVLTEYN